MKQLGHALIPNEIESSPGLYRSCRISIQRLHFIFGTPYEEEMTGEIVLKKIIVILFMIFLDFLVNSY